MNQQRAQTRCRGARTTSASTPTSRLERIAAVNQVSPGFFKTFGIEIVAGRTFDERDWSAA